MTFEIFFITSFSFLTITLLIIGYYAGQVGKYDIQQAS